MPEAVYELKTMLDSDEVRMLLEGRVPFVIDLEADRLLAQVIEDEEIKPGDRVRVGGGWEGIFVDTQFWRVLADHDGYGFMVSDDGVLRGRPLDEFEKIQ